MPSVPGTAKEFAPLLLRWFCRHQRDLPFRKTRDPYVIWVAETMLQQTQVSAVLPYFERFLRRFPSVKHLADAPLEEVLRHWAGLGYYGRAQRLHEAARLIAYERRGRFPRSREDLLALPGIGPYTAGAIRSIAYNEPEAILDGNVARVLCRLFEIGGEPRSGKTRGRLWALAGSLIPSGRAREFNQAMMELGALVCTPKKPSCASCPVSSLCWAFRHGRVSQYPCRGPARRLERVEAAAAVVLCRGLVLVTQRGAGERLAGFWEFPVVERHGRLSDRCLLVRSVKRQAGIALEFLRLLVEFEHTIVNRRIRVKAYLCRAMGVRGGPKDRPGLRWLRPQALDEVPLGAAARRIAAALKRSLNPYELSATIIAASRKLRTP